MSKITLEPNSSGAGTFSIVSPDSNTNRTLNLPDESGIILSDASTIDSNNLQSDVYKQNNILGTVSESSGVPTGAVIERGSNSNGEYVRFADGTQKCWRLLIGSTNTSSQLKSWTFPVSFTEINREGITVTTHIQASQLDSSVDSDISKLRPVVLLYDSLNNNGGIFRSNHDGNTSNNNSYSATAIGRWY